jgi:hypothetical protein
MVRAGCYRRRRAQAHIFPAVVSLPYSPDVGSDVWVGAITTLVGAALGGTISFVLSHQQLNDARMQRAEDATRDKHRRSEDRRFEAYSDFLIRARSCRNAVQGYYLHSDSRPSIEELDVLLQAANDTSALVFLLVETEGTYQACRAVLQALWRTRAIIHNIESSSTDNPWDELYEDFGRAGREFQIAARNELGVSGPVHPWIPSDESSHANIHRTTKANNPQQQPSSGTDT